MQSECNQESVNWAGFEAYCLMIFIAFVIGWISGIIMLIELRMLSISSVLSARVLQPGVIPSAIASARDGS